MRDHDVQPSGLTRRRVRGGMGTASLALMSSPALAQQTVDLHVPGGPSTRMITTSYPQKGRMIVQRSSPPWLETPFEVFDKGVFTPNDQHYVSWHWANFPGDIDVDSFRLTVRGQVNQTLSLSLKDILLGLPRSRHGRPRKLSSVAMEQFLSLALGAGARNESGDRRTPAP
jgi:DMSO/TMAO reductase YedYZ molybdopterin-dependent catalytic subunit